MTTKLLPFVVQFLSSYSMVLQEKTFRKDFASVKELSFVKMPMMEIFAVE